MNNCIHSWSGFCRKHLHDCDGEEDARRCPEWRTIEALDQFAISLRCMIMLHPGEKLIIQGLN